MNRKPTKGYWLENAAIPFLLLLSVSLGISSCQSPRQIRRATTIDYSLNTTLINQLLYTKLTFPGDYRFQTFDRKKWKAYGDPRVNVIWKQRTTSLVSGKTTIDPFFEVFVFVIPNHLFTNSSDSTIIISDTLVNQRWQKAAVLKRDTYDLCLVFYADLTINTQQEIASADLHKLLQSESGKILMTVQAFQGIEKVPSDPYQFAEQIRKQTKIPNYQNVIEQLLAKENIFTEQSEFSKSIYYPCVATYATFLGADSLATNLAMQIKADKPDSLERAYFEANRIHDTTEVSTLFAEQQVLMWNEDHISPQHRLMLAHWLPQLKKIGYRYLALEALGESGEKLQKRGFLTSQSGYYTNEVQMANLIRKALQLGFTLVEYESQEENRELGQAKNLINKTIQQDPKAKMVVLAGGSHIQKFAGNDGKRWMASYFQVLTGIEPFTINQTQFSPSLVSPATWAVVKGGMLHYPHDLYMVANIDYSKEGTFTVDNATVELDLTNHLHSQEPYQLQLYPISEKQKLYRAVPSYVYYGEERKKRIRLSVGEYRMRVKEKGRSQVVRMIVHTDGSLVIR